MRLRRAGLDGDGTRENRHGLLEAAAIGSRHTQNVQGIEMIGQARQDLPTDRLGVAMPPFAIRLDRSRQQRLGLLPGLLLQPCVLEGARAHATQLLFSTETSALKTPVLTPALAQ